MKKRLDIDGMTCEHCKKRVEDALNKLDGVQARVHLKRKQAVVTIKQGTVSDEALIEAVRQAGYSVRRVEDKKGVLS